MVTLVFVHLDLLVGMIMMMTMIVTVRDRITEFLYGCLESCL